MITSATDNAPFEVRLAELGERFARYRLHSPEAERALASSLQRYGQLSPVVVCRRDGVPEVIDGFKRVSVSRTLLDREFICAREIIADDRTAKAAMCALNRCGGRLRELEEAWIVQALVREDGLSQVEVAELLGRHKTWVCRRLALLERLCVEVRTELEVGLLTPTTAREFQRLPQGNQKDLVDVVRREALSRDEVRGVVDLLLQAPDQRGQQWVLSHPREALARDRSETMPSKDPRLSRVGNRVALDLGALQERLIRMENTLRSRTRLGLTPEDVEVLKPSIVRLSKETRHIAEAADDFVAHGLS